MKINRNIFWTENFFDRLAGLGVKYICISPGSRNTPLTIAAASNKSFKCFVHIDERSSAFFALGLAEASGQTVVLITTSGTAAAELYPAIIEAYQQRVSLIVCTADRPPELIGRGANQTINQDNIYKNHIRFFKNAGLSSVSVSGIKRIRNLGEIAYRKSKEGPVHINFPFRKPFEPKSFTDELTVGHRDLFHTLKLKEKTFPLKSHNPDKYLYTEILTLIKNSQRGLIIAGPMSFDNKVKKGVLKLADKLKYPIIADACSQFRFGNKLKNVIINYETFLRNNEFINLFAPDLILQFGRTPASRAIEIFLAKVKTKRYIINEHGDIFDPWNSAAGVFKCAPSLFSGMILKDIRISVNPDKSEWLNNFVSADGLSQNQKEKIIYQSPFPNESRIIQETLHNLPDNTHVMISNSMPVRDFDYFADRTNKKIIIHSNRGASGIDGILSTALGIQKAVNKPVVLITGDMAFYYDLNSLLTANKYKIPLVVILINNNGGGIFGMLPIARYGKLFNEYFISSHNLKFGTIVRSFGGEYKLIKSWKDLNKSLLTALGQKMITVLEIKTNIKNSVSLRKKYIKGTGKIISRNLNEN